MSTPTLVTLDKPRAMRWTHRSEYYLGSLERPPVLRDIVHRNPARAAYALAAFVWAALVERDAFTGPEQVFDQLKTTEQQIAALEALNRVMIEAGVLEDPEKKSTKAEPNGSPRGHSPSPNSGPPVPATTT